jgi:hypothetical protein
MKKLIVLLITGVCILMAYLYPQKMLSPGELMAGHQKQNNECTSCHKPFWGIDSKKCTGCHKLSEIGKDTMAGKVPSHINFINTPCTACHTDHKGTDPGKAMTTFAHDILTPSQLNNCSTCHTKPTDAVHNAIADGCRNCHQTTGWKNQVRFSHDMIAGDKNNCISCHKMPADNFHDENMTACTSCHTTSGWKPSSFNHDKYFRFDASHPGECKNCHSSNNYKTYTCYNCHEHSESKIAGEHYEHRINNFSNCANCHRSGNKHDAGGDHESGNPEQNKEKKHGENKSHDDDD